MSITPVFVQAAFRGRNDDGNETTATFKSASDNQNWTQNVDENFRVRFAVDETAGGSANNKTFQLQYSTDGTNYNDVNGTNSLVVRSSASPNLADADACTHQLTFNSGTFVGGNGFDEADGIAGGNNFDVAASGYGEVEFCVQIRSADVADGATVRLRVTSTNLATWNQIPVITVAKPARIIQPAADPWGNLADSPPTIDLRESPAKTITPPADPMTMADSFIGIRTVTGSAPPDALTLADSLKTERYWDTLSDGLVYDKQDLGAGTTPKTITPTADPWENLADAPPTVFRTGKLEIALAADPWGNLSDSPPTVAQTGTLTLAPAADPMTMGDQPPTVAMTGARAIALSADPWANLADSPPTISQGGTLAVTPPADSLNNWTDQPPTVAETGKYAFQFTGDSMSLDDLPPTVAAGGDLIATPPADALANYADTLASERSWERLADSVVYNLATLSDYAFSLTDSLNNWADSVDGQRCRPRWVDSFTGIRTLEGTVQPDSLANYADTPTVNKQDLGGTPKNITPPADVLDNYADEVNGFRLSTYTATADDLNLWADSPTVSKQDLAATPKTVTPPADAWQNLTDSPPTILRTGALTAQLTADPWQNLSDQPPTVVMTGTYALLLTGDAMTIADQPPTVAMTGKIQIALAADPMVMGDLTPVVAAGGDIRLQLPSDNLANYADTFGQSESYRLAADDLRNYDDEVDNLVLAKRYALTADPWANLTDSPPTIAKPGSLTVAPPANAMTMADAPPTIIKTALKAPSLPADAMTMGDRLGVALGLADPWETLNDAMRLGWAFKLTGDAMAFADEMQLAAGGDLPFSLPADPMTLADQWAVTYGESYQPTADAMSMDDQPVAYAAGILLTFSDDLDDWQDSRETVEGLAPQLTDDLNEYLDEMRIRGIIPAEIIRLSGKLNTSVGLSGKVIDKVGLSGHVKGNRIGVSGKLYEGG